MRDDSYVRTYVRMYAGFPRYGLLIIIIRPIVIALERARRSPRCGQGGMQGSGRRIVIYGLSNETGVPLALALTRELSQCSGKKVAVHTAEYLKRYLPSAITIISPIWSVRVRSLSPRFRERYDEPVRE